MSSERTFSASRSLGRSSIPLPIATQSTPPEQPSLDPGLNTSNQPRNATGNSKFLYTDGDVQEHPPEGNSAPIIVFPGDDATNIAVKAYLLDMLTKTGWGIAVESGKEIRATINSFVGNGWALRKRYAENRLKDICPLYMTVVEDGFANQFEVNATVRSNISKCVMREMERYFVMEYKAQHRKQYGSDGDETLTNASPEGTCTKKPRDAIPVENELVGDADDLWYSASTATSEEGKEGKAPEQVKVKELSPDANEGVDATLHAIPSRMEAHDNTAGATEVNACSTPATPDGNKVAEDASASKSTDKAIKPSQTQRPMTAEFAHWIRTLPSKTPVKPMITLPPSPKNVYKGTPEDPNAITPALPVFGPIEWGNSSTINDIPVGSKTRKIAEQEVEEARARTEEATASRQHVALTKGKERARRWLRRVWEGIKLRQHGRPNIR
ncbi:uncharacterized protein N0V89_007808 [Didymosphaeria variabile]|uniref:Uncharacterized protein n=1 Tax=Didymosphaeria variabile TaxID=1932322 RepID=A0A9W8XM74_9PLEO|nr:uncharacterized protein N0V89_007808 [Didymosphaeria variabile]KAJ4352460.1 hypothetical protein N0V89_007808 [Didymosphaeria variabile]